MTGVAAAATAAVKVAAATAVTEDLEEGTQPPGPRVHRGLAADTNSLTVRMSHHLSIRLSGDAVICPALLSEWRGAAAETGGWGRMARAAGCDAVAPAGRGGCGGCGREGDEGCKRRHGVKRKKEKNVGRGRCRED